MNRSKLTVAVLVMTVCAGLSYAIKIARATKLARSNNCMAEFINKLPPGICSAVQMDAYLRMPETLLQAASLLEGNIATEAEVEAAARILGHGSVKEAIRSEAYSAFDVARRQKPTVQPPMPGTPDDEQ